MAAPIQLPRHTHRRIHAFLARRLALVMLRASLLALLIGALALALGLSLDQLVLLPRFWRGVFLALAVAPFVGWLAALAAQLGRLRANARDMRRLDNASDDLRAAINLVERLDSDESTLEPDLVRQTVARAAAHISTPLPPAGGAWRRIAWLVVFCGLAGAGLALYRRHAPDLHTCLDRFLHVGRDYGSVGPRKFQLEAQVWENPSAVPDVAEAKTPRQRAQAYFLRERLEDGVWRKNFPPAAPTLADRIAGYNPLAVRQWELQVLEGDRLTLSFNAIDDRQRTHLEDLQFQRLEGDRAISLPFRRADGRGHVSLTGVRLTHQLMLRSGGQFSPRYRVRVVPRPTPDRIFYFHLPPSHYGLAAKETVLRDRAGGIDLNRVSGLPGARIAVEFQTPYGEDLDPKASYALLGEDRRLRLRYATSRNPERRGGGQKFWTFDFALDEEQTSDQRLYLCLQTKDARFGDEPITNRYDQALLVHRLEDLPPSVEFTRLPEQRHFAADGAFAVRYHFADDYGVAEAMLEVNADPRHSQSTSLPLELRPADKSGGRRQEDEAVYVIDLSPYRYGFLEFAVVVKDVAGQETKTTPIRVTMSDDFTETLLPKLTGGWRWAWGHAPGRFMFIAGDLETPRSSSDFIGYVGALEQLRRLLDGGTLTAKELKELSGAFPPQRRSHRGKQPPPMRRLDYQHRQLVTHDGFGHQPFAFHQRDYPYYFQRQAGAYLGALAAFDGRRLFAPVRPLLDEMAAAPDPMAAPARPRLQAYRKLVESQLKLARAVEEGKDEISLRAALLRAAHSCERLVADLPELRGMMAELRQKAGPAPPAMRGIDPWQSYPDWVTKRHADYNVRQEGRLIVLRLRNANRTLALLQRDLRAILGGRREGLDPRLLAIAGIVARQGETVYQADRVELASKCYTLARFIREGILGADRSVYHDIVRQLPACAARARATILGLPSAAPFIERVEALEKDCRALIDIDLRRYMGDPDFPASKSERWQSNQISRMRTRLELLEGHAREVLYSEHYREAQLPRMRGHVIRFQQDLAEVRDELEAWPALAAHKKMLARAQNNAEQLRECVDAAIRLQRDMGILAAFKEMFETGGWLAKGSGELVERTRVVLGEIAAHVDYARDARRANRERRALEEELRQLRDVAPPPAIKQGESKLAALVEAEKVLMPRLMRLLGDSASCLEQWQELMAGPPPERQLPAAPHPRISAASSKLFDLMSPHQVLLRLRQETAKAADQPALVDTLFETATQYFANLPTDTRKETLGNPVEEYLRARIAAALYTCSVARMGPFVETFSGNGAKYKERVYSYFKPPNHGLTPGVKAYIDKQDYSQAELPAGFEAASREYFEARRQGKFTEFLRRRREQRLTELLALTARTTKMQDHQEALIRVNGLVARLEELRDNVRLLRYPADDLRTDNLWAEIREQAEGLDRDLLAGRLASIPAARGLALRQRVQVFRHASYAEALAESRRPLEEYVAELKVLEAILMPGALAASKALQEDTKVLQRDLVVVLLSSFHDQLWFERQLAADQKLMVEKLKGMRGEARTRARVNVGRPHGATKVQATMNLAAYAWRSVCHLRLVQFSTDPTPENQAIVFADYARLLALKMLPEFYYDNFLGALGRRRHVGSAAMDVFVQQMVESVHKGGKSVASVMRYLQDPAPITQLMLEDELIQLSSDLDVGSVVFQLEKDFVAYQRLHRSIVAGKDLAAVRRAVRDVRRAPAAGGMFWQGLARPLADYLESGEEMLGFETAVGDAVRVRVQRQLRGLEAAMAYVEALGLGLGERERRELGVLEEAAAYNTSWLAALGKDAGAAEDYRAGYRDIHEAVRSYLESAQGYLFPPEGDYRPRVRYRHSQFHLHYLDMIATVLNTEERWFRRADQAHARLYQEYLRHAYGKLRGEIDPAPRVPFAFGRYLDTKFRHLMAFGSRAAKSTRPPMQIRLFSAGMPEHLARAFANALTIDLPEQDNRQVRELYFQALQDAKELGEEDQ